MCKRPSDDNIYFTKEYSFNTNRASVSFCQISVIRLAAMDFLHGKERMIKAASAIRLQGIETVQPTRPHASLHGKVSAAPLGLQHCNAPSPKDAPSHGPST
ncbi:hypothetical protein, variant [Blastomyces dermatitidis ER-3]|uniref:Uncharacterized protein n=1 Tax=Ajellomyces dermatitidis (strain ER-3 / ATCC MYA-2586) TaxID=559297 RepID=A0ABX2VRU6_AJEDR|nr:hypothetical protein, variant [Blastomyces dermatitidis ER-3]OAS99949.1 hypothetical protein, variant [Blastomyces dermatitidis ER-3]